MNRAIFCAIAALAATAAGLPSARGELTLYLNRGGGAYTPGQPNDSRQNVSSVADAPVDLPPWEIDDASWQEVKGCVAELFAPFDVAVTDADPGDAPHMEVVIGGLPGQLGLESDTAGVSPFLSNCSVIDDSIVFVFPEVLGDDPRLVCEAIAQEAAHSIGLDHQYLCEDVMTYLTGCGDKRFLFRDSVCGELEPRECRCGGRQNSARLLLERLGPGARPTLWLSSPTGEDPVVQGFVVTAAVTRAPGQVVLYVDGELYDRAPPVAEDGPYALVDLATYDLEPGAHQLDVVARWSDGTQAQESVEVEVIGGEVGSTVRAGLCSASGGSGGAPLALTALGWLFLRRRGARRRRRR